jgi:hypothetical protein
MKTGSTTHNSRYKALAVLGRVYLSWLEDVRTSTVVPLLVLILSHKNCNKSIEHGLYQEILN